jgi:hypothetical protein
MPRSTAEELAIESRRSQIAGLFLQGIKRQNELAQRVGVDRSTVSRDLKALNARWKETAVRDLDAAKGQELERIDLLEQEYWQAWEKSKNGHETTTTEQTTTPDGERTKAGIRREDQHGDPRYLAGVQWCIDKRCEILGLNNAHKVHLTGEGTHHVHIDIFQQIEQYATVLQARREQPGLPVGHVPGDGAAKLVDQTPANGQAS